MYFIEYVQCSSNIISNLQMRTKDSPKSTQSLVRITKFCHCLNVLTFFSFFSSSSVQHRYALKLVLHLSHIHRLNAFPHCVRILVTDQWQYFPVLTQYWIITSRNACRSKWVHQYHNQNVSVRYLPNRCENQLYYR